MIKLDQTNTNKWEKELGQHFDFPRHPPPYFYNLGNKLIRLPQEAKPKKKEKKMGNFGYK